jgi:hypothetical protein
MSDFRYYLFKKSIYRNIKSRDEFDKKFITDREYEKMFHLKC